MSFLPMSEQNSVSPGQCRGLHSLTNDPPTPAKIQTGFAWTIPVKLLNFPPGKRQVRTMFGDQSFLSFSFPQVGSREPHAYL